MKTNRTAAMIKLVAGIALSGAATAAIADILAGGAIFGGPAQLTGTCYLYNAGNATVSITSKQIFRETSSTPMTLSGMSPGTVCTSLPPNRACAINAVFTDGVAHSCKFVVSPSGADVRGQFEVRDAGAGNILNSVELR